MAHALGGVVGAVGLLATVAGLFLVLPTSSTGRGFGRSSSVLGLASGCLAWLMVQYLTGGAWGVVIRRPAEAAARTLPMVLLLFLPIFIGIRNLYPWSHSDLVRADAFLRHKQPYLNVPFFAIRALIYLGGWCFLSWFMNRWSAIEDRDGGLTPRRKMGALAGPRPHLLGPGRNVHGHRLGSLDRPALVFHHVRSADDRGAGAFLDGLSDRSDCVPGGAQADGRTCSRRATCTTWAS